MENQSYETARINIYSEYGIRLSDLYMELVLSGWLPIMDAVRDYKLCDNPLFRSAKMMLH